MPSASPAATPVFLPRTGLSHLVALLLARGYTVIAPTIHEGVTSYRPITSVDQLPHGHSDQQQPGSYRLVPGDPELIFERVVGADSPKRYLFPPCQRLCSLHLEKDQFVLDAGPPQVPKLAFLGIRPCDVAAIRVQDRVFGVSDPNTLRCETENYYSEARQQALIIAVNCTRPGGSCFCSSMGTGPEVTTGFDLALTELRGGFLLTTGSKLGAELAAELPTRAPSAAEVELAELKIRGAKEHMGRKLDTHHLKEILDDAMEHPQFDDIAKRCLSCGNCTLVCPTCFCATVNDSTGLGSNSATRVRQWESCFTHQFSYTTAGPVRNTIRARYRHWLRHKLSTWIDQFGERGCVGCGRCITWCPVGIDITAEVAHIRATFQPANTPLEVEMKGGLL